MEEVEPAFTPASNRHQSQGIVSADVSSMNEAMPAIPSNNEERAIVLYKPVEAPLILSSDRTNVSLQISSDLIHGLRSKYSRNLLLPEFALCSMHLIFLPVYSVTALERISSCLCYSSIISSYLK